MPTFIKTGYWESAVKSYKGWLNLEDIVSNSLPSQAGNAGKFLTTDGSTLSWVDVLSSNIYTANGTLTGNRTVTLNDKQLVFRSNQSTLQNYTFTLGTPTGVIPSTWPSSVIYEGEYIMNNNPEPYNTRVWGRNQSSSFRALWTNQVYADITGESTGGTSIYNQWFATRRGSQLDTSTNSNSFMFGVVSQVGHSYTTNQNSTTAEIVTTTQEAIRGEIINYVGTVVNSISLRSTAVVGYSTLPRNTTVTNHYGVKIDLSVGFNASFTSLLSNYYGVFISTPTVGGGGTITNRWGIYASDPLMRHYLNGNLLLGTTTDSGYKLDVTGLARVSGDMLIGGVTFGTGLGNFTTNLAAGYLALSSNTGNNQNTGVGYQSLKILTSGDRNTAVGSNSLSSSVVGRFNTAVGVGALQLSTNNSNTAIGYAAGYFNTTGANNIFIGDSSTGASVTESNRTWIGNSSTVSTWLGGALLIGTTTIGGSNVRISGLPTSSAGLSSGDLWNNGGVVNIVP